MRPTTAWPLLAALFCCASASAAAPYEATPFWESIEWDGAQREFLVYQPLDLPPGDHPLVFSIHGGGGNAVDHMDHRAAHEGLLNAKADAEKFLVIYPQGGREYRAQVPKRGYYWNDCRNFEEQRKGDDIGFLLALLDWAEANLELDPTRVFAEGISNGGHMTTRLITEAPERFAAAAIVAAALLADGESECSPALPRSPVPVLYLHGTKDALAPYGGGETAGGRGSTIGIPATLDHWAELHGADLVPLGEVLPNPILSDHCRAVAQHTGPDVSFLTVLGGGHALPGPTQHTWFYRVVFQTGWKCQDFCAADLMWAFFAGR